MGIFKKKEVSKAQQYLNMMNQWFILNQRQMSIEKYLKSKNFYVIAIYGAGLYGRHVMRDLEKTDIKVLYAIDQKKIPPFEGIEIMQLENNMPKVDVIINSVILDHKAIEQQLKKYYQCPILSLEDIIFESYGEIKCI